MNQMGGGLTVREYAYRHRVSRCRVRAAISAGYLKLANDDGKRRWPWRIIGGALQLTPSEWRTELLLEVGRRVPIGTYGHSDGHLHVLRSDKVVEIEIRPQGFVLPSRQDMTERMDAILCLKGINQRSSSHAEPTRSPGETRKARARSRVPRSTKEPA